MANKAIITGICATGITGCHTFNCKDHGFCESVETRRDQGFSHNIKTDYSVMFSGISIPIVKTIRTFSADWHTRRDAPIKTNGQWVAGEWMPVRCMEHGPDVHTCTVKEDCTIEKSVLHYIDHRYGVCLYKHTKEVLTINSSQKNNEQALFRTQPGPFHRVRVMTGDFVQKSITEWRLIANGTETILDSSGILTPAFIGGAYSSNHLDGSSQWYPNYTRPAGIHLVLVFPWPNAMGIAQSDLECGTPFYDYGTPGGEESDPAMSDGGKDMFYPEWCRNMQEDPIWKEVAARRWAAKWWRMPEEKDRPWYPPPITVDPMPRGAFAKHPKVGAVYQFLTDHYRDHVIDFGILPKVTTYPDLNSLIDKRLPDNSKTHDTTLYYPIGVI